MNLAMTLATSRPKPLALAALASLLACAAAQSQTSPYAFSYQGMLQSDGAPTNGLHDMRFELLDEGGSVVTTLCARDVLVQHGVFSLTLDPGVSYPFNAHQQQTMRVSVRASTGTACEEPAGYEVLTPDQRIRPTPLATRATFAVQSTSALSLNGLPPSHFTNPSNLVGTIPLDKLPQSLARADNTNLFTSTNAFMQPVGVGTTPGSEMLRIRAEQSRATLVSDFSTNGSVLTLENQTTGLATGNYVGAVNFAVPGSTPGQIGYVRGPQVWQDTMQFRVGSLPGVAIDGSARLGVGTLAPQSRVHIASSSSGIAPNPNTMLLIDTLGTNYITSLISNNEESGVLFGRPAGGHAEAGIVFNNPGTRGGLQLRTGGNQTRMFIDSAGTVTVPGNVNAGSITTSSVTYPTPKVHHKALGVRAFMSTGGGAALTGLSAERLTGSNYSSLGTSLDLPHGATITNVTLYVFDNDATGNMAISLSQTTFAGQFTVLRAFTTSGAQLGYQAIDLTPPGPYVVNNTNNMLNLEIGMAVLSPWSNAMAIIGARVTYTTTSAQ
jgi:hypothetical protein